jgi:16S rRNA (cytosine967-C5)-methyltransferase
MHPAARVQAVIEIVNEVLENWAQGGQLPADVAFAQYVRTRRFIGSKDRRALAELFYAVQRGQGVVRWWLERLDQPVIGRNLVLGMLQQQGNLSELSPFFGANAYAPAALSDVEQGWLAQFGGVDEVSPAARANMPEWLYAKFQAQWGGAVDAELAALQQAASMVLRVNTLKTTRDKALAALKHEGVEAEATTHSPLGIRVMGRVNLEQLAVYQQGWVETQDESSQLACLSLSVQPGMTVVDLGCGAGGKSLALAAEMQNRGKIIAADIDARRMADLPARATRAGISIIAPHVLPADGAFPREWLGMADAVFLDAPCSGLGTLRRHPDVAWRVSEAQIALLQRTQMDLLEHATALLKPGGMLLYATCSLLNDENKQVINNNINEKLMLTLAPWNQLWNNIPQTEQTSCGTGFTLTPHRHQTDGFFMALLQHR